MDQKKHTESRGSMIYKEVISMSNCHHRGRHINFYRKIMVCLFMCFSALTFASDMSSHLHSRGKKYVRERKWRQAIQTYNQLLEEQSSGQYSDDAAFWIGFSQEQIPGMEKDAFESFNRVAEVYPGSPWMDDARIHQIMIARKLYKMEDGKYNRFLKKMILDENIQIRYQAALALAAFKDTAAMPVLEEMINTGDEDMAGKAMEALEGYSDILKDDFSDVSEDDEFANKEPLRKADSNILFRKLHREGESWTKERLLRNGLFHIVSQKDLIFYLSLENEWDQKEWWRKFWKSRDPTPTTELNEAEKEFISRVMYAWENFGREWNFEKDYYPPWDSRGEVYIKLGEPDKIKRRGDGWEEWTYRKHRIALRIADYLPNHKGEGIVLGVVSKYLYKKNIRINSKRFTERSLFAFSNPEFDKARKISDLTFKLESATDSGNKARASFEYAFPAENIRFKSSHDVFQGTYTSRWVLFDEDYRVVQADGYSDNVVFNSRKEILENEIYRQIQLDLMPGSYLLALRIEDKDANRLGIYKKRFNIKNKGVQEISNE